MREGKQWNDLHFIGWAARLCLTHFNMKGLKGTHFNWRELTQNLLFPELSCPVCMYNCVCVCVYVLSVLLVFVEVRKIAPMCGVRECVLNVCLFMNESVWLRSRWWRALVCTAPFKHRRISKRTWVGQKAHGCRECQWSSTSDHVHPSYIATNWFICAYGVSPSDFWASLSPTFSTFDNLFCFSGSMLSLLKEGGCC